MKKFTRVFALLMAVVMVLGMSTVAFAATPEPIIASTEEAPEASPTVMYEATYKVSSDTGITLVDSSDDSGIMPLSSVGGYSQKSMWGSDKDWGSNNYVYVDCDGSGFGGMGITIKTSCSYGNYQIKFAGAPYAGEGSSISGEMGTIDEVQFHNLWHIDLQEYLLLFTPATDSGYVPDYYVQVWIYG